MIQSIRPLTFGDLEVGDTFRHQNARGKAGPSVYRKINGYSCYGHLAPEGLQPTPVSPTALVIREDTHAAK